MLEPVVRKLADTTVQIREVGLREGLQSHPLVLRTEDKIELFRGLASAGLKEINAVAFVNPAKMPHMGDTEDLLRGIAPYKNGIDVSGVVFSEGRLSKAIELHDAQLLDTIFLIYSPVAASMAANGIVSDTEALLAQIERCAARAGEAGLRVEVFVSESFGSPVAGWISPELVVRSAQRIRAMKGVSGLIISDSTGQGDPVQTLALFTALAEVLPIDERLTFHIHDSRGAGMANAFAALLSPFRHFCFDSSFGGLGGDFPFVPDAFGNVATEDLVGMLSGMGFETGIDVDRIVATARSYASMSGRPLGSRLSGCEHSQEWKRANRLINPLSEPV